MNLHLHYSILTRIVSASGLFDPLYRLPSSTTLWGTEASRNWDLIWSSKNGFSTLSTTLYLFSWYLDSMTARTLMSSVLPKPHGDIVMALSWSYSKRPRTLKISTIHRRLSVTLRLSYFIASATFPCHFSSRPS